MTVSQETRQSFEELVIPSSLSFVAPTRIDSLIRVGKTHDGGYVIPEFLIRETDCLVSFGIEEDWSFDEHFIKLNPSITIHAYDHTVSRQTLLRSVQSSLLRACLGKSSIKDLSKRLHLLRSYESFFSGPATHFVERIRNRADRGFDVTLDTVFGRAHSERIFLKIDIEGTEYRIIDDILRFADRVTGMVIEFHDTDPLRQVFVTSIRKLQERFEIVHLHANNYGGVARDQLPDVLEVTFVKRERCQIGEKRKTLPVPLVDSPNAPNISDYKIRFDC